MPWSDAYLSRDCGWCGTKKIAMVCLWGGPISVAGGPSREWHVLSCPHCGAITLIETRTGVRVPSLVRVMPEHPEAVGEVKHVPEQINKHYVNAARALASGLSGAAAVELRRTLEGAAAAFDVKQGNLAQSIRELIDKGLITKGFAKAPQHVRLIGNQGAHFNDDDVTVEQAQRALDFTTQVLRNLFEVPGELALLDEANAAATGETAEAPAA
jgi:hypothetical protein